MLFSDARMQLLMANEVILRLDIGQESRPLSALEVQLLRELQQHVLIMPSVFCIDCSFSKMQQAGFL